MEDKLKSFIDANFTEDRQQHIYDVIYSDCDTCGDKIIDHLCRMGYASYAEIHLLNLNMCTTHDNYCIEQLKSIS